MKLPKLKFSCCVPGVILNDNELTQEQKTNLEEQGYLVLSSDEQIEIENEYGELVKGDVTFVNDDFFLFDVYDNEGRIIHEEEIQFTAYLYQLQDCGALDCYPLVELD